MVFHCHQMDGEWIPNDFRFFLFYLPSSHTSYLIYRKISNFRVTNYPYILVSSFSFHSVCCRFVECFTLTFFVFILVTSFAFVSYSDFLDFVYFSVDVILLFDVLHNGVEDRMKWMTQKERRKKKATKLYIEHFSIFSFLNFIFLLQPFFLLHTRRITLQNSSHSIFVYCEFYYLHFFFLLLFIVVPKVCHFAIDKDKLETRGRMMNKRSDQTTKRKREKKFTFQCYNIVVYLKMLQFISMNSTNFTRFLCCSCSLLHFCGSPSHFIFISSWFENFTVVQ